MTVYPRGHKLRPIETEDFAGLGGMWCRNCLVVNPEPGSECDDEED